MFILFTPFSFMFICLYVLVLFFLFSLTNFYFYWVFMEILMLLFLGISYTLFSSSFTQLMLYFLMQTLASFSMLVFYILSLEELFVMSLFLKLGMFPFMSWYLDVLFKFPSFMLFLSSTFHKLPPLFLFYIFYNSFLSSFLLFSILISLLVGGSLMLMVLDFRYLLIVSSMANNSFLLLGLMGGSLMIFSFFFIMYVSNMFLALLFMNGLTKPLFSFSRMHTSMIILLLLLLLMLAAMPPMPTFFAKFAIFYQFFLTSQTSVSFLILMVLANVMLMGSYCQLFVKFMIQTYSNSSNHLLF